MGDVHILPSGKSVTLRSPEEVSERLRRPVGRAILRVREEVEAIRQQIPALNDRVEELEKQKADPATLEAARDDLGRKAREFAAAATDDEVAAYDMQNDLAAVALVARWDFPEPVSLDAVMDLPHADYDALRAMVAPQVTAMFMDVSPSPNPPAPTGGSNGSGQPSVEAPPIVSLMRSETTA